MSSGTSSTRSEDLLDKIRGDVTFRRLKARYERDPDTLLHSIIHYAYCNMDFFEILVADPNKCVQLFDEPLVEGESMEEDTESSNSSKLASKLSKLEVDKKNLFTQMGFPTEKVDEALKRYETYEKTLDFLLGKRP